jgi:hypothetical protein
MQLHSFRAGPYGTAANADALLVERAEAIMRDEDSTWKSFQADSGSGIEGPGM